MKRALGALVVVGLIGGAVWIGLTSQRGPAPVRVESIDELAQILSERGLGCGYPDRTVPGMPPRGADYGVCDIGGQPAALYVFEGSAASFASRFEPDFKGGWVVGDNWVLTVHDGELAIEVAERLGAEALSGRHLRSTLPSTARCDEDIPFEPTYLPAGFKHKQFEGRFPDGKPLDDQRSTGGKRHQKQVVVHYRGPDGRGIEIRRPGTEFTELAQGNDAPTIEVLGTETSGFAPIGPGGDEFIVQFRYPAGAKPHQWCSLYSLNEYGVSLGELKKVAEGLRPVTDGRLDCPDGDLIQVTSVTIGGPGFIGSPEQAVRNALNGLRDTDVLLATGGSIKEVLIFRGGKMIGSASAYRSPQGGWLVDSSSVCESSNISH